MSNVVDTSDLELEHGKNSVFFVNIKDENQLYHQYMPYINGGALFILTDHDYKLGDEVFLLVKLLDEKEKYTVAGEVVWITPKAAQAGRPAGIGVKFVGEEAKQVRDKIETYLAGALQSDRHTDTM